jgi:hypothetical protein
MRPIRGASDRPVRFPHRRCACTYRATPGIHASTTSAARSYRNRLWVRSVDARLGRRVVFVAGSYGCDRGRRPRAAERGQAMECFVSLRAQSTHPRGRDTVPARRYEIRTEVRQVRAGSAHLSDRQRERSATPPSRRQHFSRAGELGLLDFARAQAARADVGAAGDAAHQNPDPLQVRIEAPSGSDHRVASVVTEGRTLAAD